MKLRSLCFLCALCVSALNVFSLDREAFTFTKYDLDVRVEPEQQRLGARGTITLRNDSSISQKTAVLQVSSSLGWRSVKAGDKPLQFVTQTYTSDIDHTGALSEAIVTLPDAIAPKGAVDLEIAYEGVIVLDATRLTRIGTPEATAHSNDWDQITTNFAAVRGVGYVAWYPIATEAVDLSDGANFFDVLGRWKAREAASKMHLKIDEVRDDGEVAQLVVNEASCGKLYEQMGRSVLVSADCTYQPLGFVVPTFATGNYKSMDRAGIEVLYMRGHDGPATNYADAAEKIFPFVSEWFGAPRSKVQTADLGSADAAPFESGSLLLTPLTSTDPKLAGLAAAHQLAHAAFTSPRPWIDEGLAHFAQALYVEHQSGRQAALGYLGLHRSGLSTVEQRTTAPRSEDENSRSLINTADEELYRSKAMYVWWMLRDIVGEAALKKALASYRPEQDKEPSYLPRLIQAQTQRDLEWFFEDWVYRDHGLPDFKVESAFPRKTINEAYLLTVTVANLGRAGAEVPITVKFAGGEITKRLEVRGNSKAVIRVDVSKPPQEIVVNDGSVPESGTGNNVFKIEGETAK